DFVVVVASDIELLVLAGTILQLKSLLDAFVHLPGLTGVGGDDPQFSPRDGKIWIKFDGALVMGNGALVIEVLVGGVAEAIGLQSFERRSGGLLQRRGEFLNGRQRLAQLASETGGGFVEGLEDLLLAFGFGLFAGNGVSGLRVDGGEGDHVMSAERSDGAGQHGSGAFADADFV